jgi:hypothetical protein
MEQWSRYSTIPLWNSTYGYAMGRSSSVDLHLQVQAKPPPWAQMYLLYIHTQLTTKSKGMRHTYTCTKFT